MKPGTSGTMQQQETLSPPLGSWKQAGSPSDLASVRPKGDCVAAGDIMEEGENVTLGAEVRRRPESVSIRLPLIFLWSYTGIRWAEVQKSCPESWEWSINTLGSIPGIRGSWEQTERSRVRSRKPSRSRNQESSTQGGRQNRSQKQETLVLGRSLYQHWRCTRNSAHRMITYRQWTIVNTGFKYTGDI